MVLVFAVADVGELSDQIIESLAWTCLSVFQPNTMSNQYTQRMHSQQATPYEDPLLIHQDPPGFGDPADWQGRPPHYLAEPRNAL